MRQRANIFTFAGGCKLFNLKAGKNSGCGHTLRMVEVNAVIQNEAGIHCRPTAVITQAAVEYSGRIKISAPSGSCNLGSALELMMLGLDHGTPVTIQVSGEDEAATAAKFKELFERHFDFPNAGQE